LSSKICFVFDDFELTGSEGKKVRMHIQPETKIHSPSPYRRGGGTQGLEKSEDFVKEKVSKEHMWMSK
jgi:hypothetical protein